MELYDIQLDPINNDIHSMGELKNTVILVVNTASKCGYTPQFEALEALYQTYKDEDFIILGFPCNQFKNQDPGTNASILAFCTLHYAVTFPMFQKTRVKGPNKHPLFDYLVKNAPYNANDPIAWNFEKFLINKEGQITKRYLSNKDPLTLKDDIKQLLEMT